MPDGKTQGLGEEIPVPNDKDAPTNVIVLAEKKTRGRPKVGEDAPPKMAPAETYAMVSAMISRRLTAVLPAPFPEHFLAVSSDGGKTKTLVEVGDGDVCTPIRPQRVVDAIVRYCGHDIIQKPGFRLDHRQAGECAKYWMAETPCAPPPSPFLFASEPGLCYRRIPFDPLPMPTPIYDEMGSRMGDMAEAAAAFCGSIFDMEADRQQYLYLYGHGGDGKGSLARLLSRILGASATSVSAPPMRNKHWACDYVDRRLVIFSDLTDARALRAAELRAVTGGDAVTVDPKRLASYSAVLTCKLLLCSNEMPLLSSNAADIRRIIFVEMTAPRERREGYEEELWREAPGIVHKWLAAYAKRSRGHGEIRLSPSEQIKIGGWARASDEVFEAYFSEHLVVDAQASVRANDLARRLRKEDGGKQNGPFSQAWRAWLRRTHPSIGDSVPIKFRGKLDRWYFGMRLKQPLVDDARVEDTPTARVTGLQTDTDHGC